MFKLSNICFSYDQKDILKGFSLVVKDGECVALCGPSGCGKTTAALILCDLLKPTSGNVSAPKRISVVFQEDRLLNDYSVEKNLKITVKDITFAESLLKEVGLYEYRHKKVRELSGGMKRRLSFVRAVAFCGDGIILDEAFNGMDKENKEICAAIIKREFLDKNRPVLLISHNKEDIDLLKCKTVEMKNGG